MTTPMNLMLTTATNQAATLSCNKALEKSLDACKQLRQYLLRLIEAHEADDLRANDLSITCVEVNACISDGVITVKLNLQKRMERFKRDLSQKAQEVLQEYAQNLEVEETEEREFASKNDADAKVAKVLRELTRSFNSSLDQVFADKKTDLNNFVLDLKSDMNTHIFDHLRRIFYEIREEEGNFAPQLIKTELQLDTTSLGFNHNVVTSQEKSTSFKTKLFSLLNFQPFSQRESVYIVDYEHVKRLATEQLQEYTSGMVENACVFVEKSMAKVLDGLFLEGLRKVGQLREALSQRDRLRQEGVRMKKLLNDLDLAINNLGNLLKNLE